MATPQAQAEPVVPLEATKQERSVSHCRSARKGLTFYRIRAHRWKILRGAESEVRIHQPRGCAHVRWLASEWKERAWRARQAYHAWYRTTGLVVARLDARLVGTPMEGTGQTLERLARRHRVSPYFVVAVAATESSIGVAACSSNRKNVWGLASCVNSWPVPYFETWEEAYDFFLTFVNQRFPGHSSPYSFRGYAACSECWARKVSEWMSRLFGVGASTRYP